MNEVNEVNILVRCKKCYGRFTPDIKTRKPWICSNCGKKNPNLKRHYRSVADVFILGLISTVIFWWISLDLNANKMLVDVIMFSRAMHVVLLLLGIISLYRSKTPWAEPRIKFLIWLIFGSAFLFNVAFPLFRNGQLNILYIVVLIPVYIYLTWLQYQASKCSLRNESV